MFDILILGEIKFRASSIKRWRCYDRLHVLAMFDIKIMLAGYFKKCLRQGLDIWYTDWGYVDSRINFWANFISV